MESRSIGGTVVGVLVAIGFIGYKFHAKDKTDLETKQRLHEFVAQCDCYEANRAYLDDLCDQAHEKAFADSYRMGGRRTSTRFDEDRYVDEAMTFIVEHARKDGHKDIVKSLEHTGADDQAPPPAETKPPPTKAPYKGGRG
jgi:hypothetical protein